MRAKSISLVCIAAFVVVLAGCNPIVSSSIPKAVTADPLIKTAGSSQGIVLGGGSSSESSDSRSFEVEHRSYVSISSGTSGQLMAAYRREVEQTITKMGGSINGTGISGTTNNVEDFSYDYTWGGNDGIVRVYSFTGTNGKVQIVSFCYEHRK